MPRPTKQAPTEGAAAAPTNDEIAFDAPEPEQERAAEMFTLSDEDIARISEVITEAQIDRLVRLKANIKRRDEYMAKGIRPSTHVIVVSGLTHLYEDKNGDHTRKESKAGEALEIAKFKPDHLAELRTRGQVEAPI